MVSASDIAQHPHSWLQHQHPVTLDVSLHTSDLATTSINEIIAANYRSRYLIAATGYQDPAFLLISDRGPQRNRLTAFGHDILLALASRC